MQQSQRSSGFNRRTTRWHARARHVQVGPLVGGWHRSVGTKEWREQTSFIASTTASMVCREILWVCKEYGFDKEELWKAEMNAHIQGIQKFGRLNLEKTVQYCLNALIGLSNSKDCPEKDEFIVKQVISKAWERALQLPEKGVVLESL